MKKAEKIDFQIGVGAVNISEKAKKLVNQALNNNRLSYGKFSQEFESKFAALHQCKFGIVCNSGTSALEIAVAALKELGAWKDGDEIIVPAITFVASVNVILQNNLTPVFVDVDKYIYNIDPKKIEECITPKTKAIMVVHLFGHPADMNPIMKIASKYNLRIIEDSCETVFAKYQGRSVGSFGDIGCFSTYACHIVVTGVGGLALTNSDEAAVVLRSLANHGRDNIYISIDDDKNKSKESLKMIMKRRFSFIRKGYSYRITELEAALGVAQMDNIATNIDKRRKNADFLINNLKKWEKFIQLPTILKGTEHSFMMFPIVIKQPQFLGKPQQLANRDELTFFLEENNIETRLMLPLVNQPYLKKLFGAGLEERYPIAKHINNNGFYIGCHPELGEKELQYIARKFDEFFNRIK
ncbi:DegT/DnrJ/EryC1/StrS family aminotransferase [Candidatus Woesearchaeota archaeon]|nr:DegT/DnrJ/EryC1/StrS family aminotransferase [Candidatus Woesearchaeota archaeon]